MLNGRHFATFVGLTASAWGLHASASPPCSPFQLNARECVILARANPIGATQLVFQNRCAEPIAILVAACDPGVHPTCKSDPLRSHGWAVTRGIEYLRGTQPQSEPALLSDGALLRTMTQGPAAGWRAQIVACRLSTVACASGLAELRKAVDRGEGQSLHAAMRAVDANCKGESPWA